MVGVIFFSLVGMIFGILCANDLVKKILKNETVERFFNKIDKYDLVIGIIGISIGIWNLFSPNFGFKTDSLGDDITILGAAIPSSLVILSSITICLHYLLQILNISTVIKEKLLSIRNQYADLIGIITFVFSFLHILTYQTILI